mgnify:CR=1 FL=1
MYADPRENAHRIVFHLLQHGASSRNRLLREYRQSERAVLLGTRTFWEGIDLPGEQLSVLCIVRLPFAVPSDPLVAARSAEFDNAFRDFTVPDAILRFRQGFGRLIRTKTDRGVVVVADKRVLTTCSMPIAVINGKELNLLILVMALLAPRRRVNNEQRILVSSLSVKVTTTSISPMFSSLSKLWSEPSPCSTTALFRLSAKSAQRSSRFSMILQ